MNENGTKTKLIAILTSLGVVIPVVVWIFLSYVAKVDATERDVGELKIQIAKMSVNTDDIPNLRNEFRALNNKIDSLILQISK